MHWLLLILRLFPISIALAGTHCHRQFHTPFPYRAYPSYDDCFEAINMLWQEPDSDRYTIISTDSRLVPIGGYLYPHIWYHGTCALKVDLMEPFVEDQAKLHVLGSLALVIANACIKNGSQLGGLYLYAGTSRRILVRLDGVGAVEGLHLPKGDLNATLGLNGTSHGGGTLNLTAQEGPDVIVS